MAQMAFHRVERMARGHIGRTRADPRQQHVGGVAKDLEVRPFGHVAVVIDPRGIDRGFQEHRRAARWRLAPGQPRAVRLDRGAGCEIVARQRGHHVDQARIAQAFVFAQRYTGGLFVGLRGHTVGQLVGQFAGDQLGPRQFQRGAELREEMAHPRLAAGQTVGQERAHERPAQARAIADGIVDLCRGGDTVVDQPQRLSPQGFEQAIGDEAIDFHAHLQRLHAAGGVERGGGVLCRLVGGIAAADLDQRQQVNRIERMADDKAFGVRHLRLQAAGQQARSGRGDHHIGPRRRLDFAQHADFQRFDFGQRFLDEIGAGHRIGQAGGNVHRAFRRAQRAIEPAVRGAGIGQHRLDLAPGFGIGIVQPHIEPRQRKARRPARADDARPDQADGANVAHDQPHRFTSLSFSRTSAGPSTRAPMPSTISFARSTSWPFDASCPRPR